MFRCSKGYVSVIAALFFVAILSSTTLFVSEYFNQKAYADGLTQENLPPATVGNRKASLFVKVSPPILTTDTKGNTYLQMRLFDANTNETIQHVTYDITVTKGTSQAGSGTKPILRDFFHAHNGLLTLKIEPINTTGGQVTINGERDPFQNAWVADPGGTINIRGPVLNQGGLYHIHIEIFGIDNDRNLFIPEQAPKFDSYLSVGDVYRNNIADSGQKYNSTLISYYDKINNFKFDPNTKNITWQMPFDWNLSRIKQQNIFVHEELRLPKSWKSFVGSGFAGSFNATVNGIPVTGRSLAIDPFSFPNALVLHYLINKDDIIKIAEARQKQLEHPEQQHQGNVSGIATATKNSSSSSSLPVNASNVGSTNNTNNSSNKTATATTTTAKASNTTTVSTTIKKLGQGSPSATVNKTAYEYSYNNNNNDVRSIHLDRGANVYAQNMVKPKLVLIAANSSGLTNANTNGNNGTNSSGRSNPNPNVLNKQKAPDEGLMTFALMSNTESNKGTPAATATAQTSSDLVTDTGAIHVIVSWSPNPLEPTKESTVKIQFSDAMTSGSLNSDVKYDLIILDKNGTTAVKKENLLAKNGLGTENVAFPAKDVYQLEIKIKGLQKTGSVPDLSRNGIARGYVVVPEFPSFTGSALLISGLFAFAIFFTRRFKSAYKM
ncbi:MAG TPA: hypothetical protein VH500_05745 [Nitrososphaeraceae archaeon]